MFVPVWCLVVMNKPKNSTQKTQNNNNYIAAFVPHWNWTIWPKLCFKDIHDHVIGSPGRQSRWRCLFYLLYVVPGVSWRSLLGSCDDETHVLERLREKITFCACDICGHETGLDHMCVARPWSRHSLTTIKDIEKNVQLCNQFPNSPLTSASQVFSLECWYGQWT